MSVPSVRALKETAPDEAAHSVNPVQEALVEDVLASKGADPHAISLLASNRVLGRLIDTYLLGNEGGHQPPERRNAARAARHWTDMTLRAAEAIAGGAHGTYTGTPEENASIVRGNYHTTAEDPDDQSPLRDFRRNGASRQFRSGLVAVNAAERGLGATFTPIAIVGGGASGVLAGRTLRDSGFRNVTIFDNGGDTGGIWGRDNVRLGTKNNPFAINYDTTVMLPPGRRDKRGFTMMNDGRIERSGQDVSAYIDEIAEGDNRSRYSGRRSVLRVEQGHVKSIEPGDLNHELTIVSKDGEEKREFPIVIYAPGVGEPLPISDPYRMETPNARHEAGRRWQQQLSEEELKELAGKKVVLIGLGNSTAEMLFQFQKFEERTGTDIDYTVLTHYPEEALRSPWHRVTRALQPVFRDLTEPNLVRLAGDLTHIQTTYLKALHQGKIAGDVVGWARDDGHVTATTRDGIPMELPADELYTLIGYRQNPAVLDRMGIEVIDDGAGIGAYDFDGEVQKAPGEAGRDRLHAGFFAVGPITKTPYNPNAMVIPGIQHQLGDLLPTVSLRAAEYALRPGSQWPIRRAQLAYFGHIARRQSFMSWEMYASTTRSSPKAPPPRY